MNSSLNYSIRASGWASFAVFVLDVSSLAPVHDNILTRPKVMTWLRRTFAGGFALLGAKLAFAGR
jgi:threonine/homoserine/homoserine lactone efflux protein